MATRKVKGITIELNGQTTKLNKALSDSKKRSRELQQQLREVKRELFFDPTNVELLAQKTRLQTEAAKNAADQTEILNKAVKNAGELVNNGQLTQTDFDSLTREIGATIRQTEYFEKQTESTQKQLRTSIRELNAEQKEGLQLLRNGDIGLDAYKKIKQDVEDAKQELIEFREETSRTYKAFSKISDYTGRAGDFLKSTGETLTNKITKPGIGLGVAGVAGTTKIAQSIEDARVGLLKVSDYTEEEYRSLDESAKKLSNSLAVPLERVYNIYEVYAKMKFKASSLEKATEATIKAEEATNLMAENMSEVVGYSIKNSGLLDETEVDRFISLLVALGNTSIATEDKIAEMFLSIAPVAKLMGKSLEDTLADAELLATSGIGPEAGGTAYKRLMSNFETGVAVQSESYEKLDKLASSYNMTVEELINNFNSYSGKDATQNFLGINKEELKEIKKDLKAVEGLIDNGNFSLDTEKNNKELEKSKKAYKNISQYLEKYGLTFEEFKAVIEDGSQAIFDLQGIDGNLVETLVGDFESSEDTLQELANLFGVSTSEIVDLFNSDPGDFLVKVVNQMTEAEKQGKSLSALFSSLDINNERDRDVLRSFALNAGDLEGKRQLVRDESQNPTALDEEYAKRAETLTLRWREAWETIKNEILLPLGETLLPIIKEYVGGIVEDIQNLDSEKIKELAKTVGEKFKEFLDMIPSIDTLIEKINNLDPDRLKDIIDILKFLIIAGPILSILGSGFGLVSNLAEIIALISKSSILLKIQTFVSESGGFIKALKLIGSSTGGVAVILAGVLALIFYLVTKHWDDIKAFWSETIVPGLEFLGDFLKEFFTGLLMAIGEIVYNIIMAPINAIKKLTKLPDFIKRDGAIDGIKNWVSEKDDILNWNNDPKIFTREQMLEKQKDKKNEKESNYNSNINIDKMVVRDDRDIEDIAKELYRLEQRGIRRA